MSISLVEVMAAASQRLAPLSGECAGHAVLAAADQLLTNPRLVGPEDVLLEENGAVRLGHGRAADAGGCDAALRELLDGLLTVAHSGGAGLMRVGRRAATGDLEQLVKELEVALIPANRAAARRSLARLYRETCRAREAGTLSVQPLPVPERRVPVPPPLPAAPPPVRATPPVSEPAATHEPLAETEIRWATAARETRAGAAPPAAGAAVPPPAPPEAELVLEVVVDAEITPVIDALRHTQPLPQVESRRAPHQTVPLPPVRPRPRVPEHETPLEPVLSRRHAGLPSRRGELPDIHETPYLGTQVSSVPLYDERAREAWQVARHTVLEATPAAEWDTDESTTDPAPVVEWCVPDEDAELVAAAPLAPCPALAVEPRVTPLPQKEPRVFRPSDVEELVERFRIAEPEPEPQLARSLKQLAGITATPPPARADEAPATAAPRALPEPAAAGAPLGPKRAVPGVGS
jgi:hypothetical protein